MKKVIGLCMAILASATFFVGCGEQAVEKIGQGEVNNFYFEIGDGELYTASNGKEYLLIDIKFQNNSDSAQDFQTSTIQTYYQDGTEVYAVYPIWFESSKDLTREIEPGNSIDVQTAVEIKNNTSPVRVEIASKSHKNDKVIKEITL